MVLATILFAVTLSTKPTSSEHTSPTAGTSVTQRTKNVISTVTPSSHVKSSTTTVITKAGSMQSNGSIVPTQTVVRSKTSASESTSNPVVSKASVTKLASTSATSSAKMSITKVPYHRSRTTQDNVLQLSSPKGTAGESFTSIS